VQLYAVLNAQLRKSSHTARRTSSGTNHLEIADSVFAVSNMSPGLGRTPGESSNRIAPSIAAAESVTQERFEFKVDDPVIAWLLARK
jgi:hypothetical protein